MSGEETFTGHAPTPDQDVVDELGAAAGLTYEDDEPLNYAKVAARDRHRWELDPRSAVEEQSLESLVDEEEAEDEEADADEDEEELLDWDDADELDEEVDEEDIAEEEELEDDAGDGVYDAKDLTLDDDDDEDEFDDDDLDDELDDLDDEDEDEADLT
jgi:hypothetical protein